MGGIPLAACGPPKAVLRVARLAAAGKRVEEAVESVGMHRRRRLWCTGAVEEAGGAALAPLGFGDPPSPRVLSGRRTAEQGTTGAKDPSPPTEELLPASALADRRARARVTAGMVALARAMFKTDVRRTPGPRDCRRDYYFPRPRPTHAAAASWSVYDPRALRALVYPRSDVVGETHRSTPCRCVAGEPTRSATSPLTRLAPSRCRRPPPGYVTELAEPSSAPSPPALPTRNRGRSCQR